MNFFQLFFINNKEKLNYERNVSLQLAKTILIDNPFFLLLINSTAFIKMVIIFSFTCKEKWKRKRILQTSGRTQESTGFVAKNAGSCWMVKYWNTIYCLCRVFPILGTFLNLQERLRRTKTLEETCKKQEKVGWSIGETVMQLIYYNKRCNIIWYMMYMIYGI